MNAKPIFLAKLPRWVEVEQVTEINQRLSDKLTDYHVLVVHSPAVTEPTFQALYDKDLIEIDFETFKEEVFKSIA